MLHPRSVFPGVIGIDKKEYPVPTHELAQETFTHNIGLIDRKLRHGFTKDPVNANRNAGCASCLSGKN